MAARIVAVLLAVGMVASALAVRAALDRDDDPGGGGGRGDVVLVCARELGDLCDDLDARKEDANVTADRLIGLAQDADPELDAWLVPGPWPQMVDEVRAFERKPPIFEGKETLGWSRLVVIARDGSLDEACGGEWTCVTDGSRDVAAPATKGVTGVLARAAPLSAWIGDTDYSRSEIEEHAAALADLDRALNREQFGAGSLRRFLATRAGADAFVTTQAAARADGAGPPFTVARPEPAVEVALTLGLRQGASKPDGINDLVLDHGWSSPQTAAAVDDGLPSPDVLFALREFLE